MKGLHVPRNRLLRTAVALAALLVAVMIAIPASAGPVGINAGFEDDDGNLVDNATDANNPITAGIDWNTFAPTTWTGAAQLRTASDTASGWTLTGKEDREETTQDSAFAGGTKQDHNCATVGAGKAPNKDDLKRVYLATKTVPVDEDPGPGTDLEDHVFLMLSWVRIEQNTTSPSAHIGFEFNKGTTACSATSPLVQRTAGDMLIVYDFEGGAGDAPVLTLRRWVTSGSCEVTTNSPPCWGPAQNLTADGDAEGRVNTTAEAFDAVADPDETLGLNEFGEAGIDLTDADVFTPGQCESFGNSYAVSRSSGNSAQAQMKDLVGPVPFQLQNCGSVKIIKQTDPRGLNQNFGFTSTLAGTQLSCTGDTTPAAFNLNDNGNSGKTLGSTDALQNSAGNTESCANVPIGQYTVTEGADPTGFAFDSVTCTNSGGNSTSTSGKVATINVAGGGSTTCLYINDQQLGAIKITKTGKDATCTGSPLPAGCQSTGVRLLSGAQFTIKKGTATVATVSTTNGTVCVDNLAFGTDYTVQETTPPTGYKADTTAAQSVTVDTNAGCSDTTYVGETISFTNTPLSRVRVIFTSLAGAGVTKSQIVCKQGSTVIPAQSENGNADNETTPVYDDTDETIGNGTTTLVPGVYTCTIDIDP